MAGEDNFKIEKLSAGNYATWAEDMEALLTLKGLWAAVEAAQDGVNAAKAKALLMLHVDKSLKPVVKDCTNAHSAWQRLQEMYAQQSNAARLQLHEELTTLKKREDESISKYVARVRQIKDNLIAAGDNLSSEAVLMRMLAGLPADYGMVRTVITHAEQLPTLEEALPKLLVTEKQLELQNPGKQSNTTKAYVGTHAPRYEMRHCLDDCHGYSRHGLRPGGYLSHHLT